MVLHLDFGGGVEGTDVGEAFPVVVYREGEVLRESGEVDAGACFGWVRA